MKKNLFSTGNFWITIISCVIILGSCTGNRTTNFAKFPAPVEGEENEKLREKYQELRHKTAPGVEWKVIEAANARELALHHKDNAVQGTYANGNITGNWFERGADNQAGSIRAMDYIPSSNKVIAISNGGSLWSNILGSGIWTPINQQIRFEQKAILAFAKNGGGERIVAAANGLINYSDNNGATFTPSGGLSYPVGWGGNYIASIYKLNDGSNHIYCLARLWDPTPWAPRFWLYRSTNEGTSFSVIHKFTVGNDNQISAGLPYNNNTLIVADIGTMPGSIVMYSVTGATVTNVNTFAIGGTIDKCLLKGTFVGGVYHLYAMLNNNKLYYSNNLGANWVLRSNLPTTAWEKMNVSINDPLIVSYGEVEAYRSSNGGVSFTKVNNWGDYYADVANKLHADIMEIEYYKRTDGTEFCLINTHGGTYISNDNLVTVSNQSLTSHRATEYYDVITDTLNTNIIFTGTQDQGLQRTLAGNNTSIQNYIQVISGDYGHMSLTYNNNILWPQYPGGTYYLFTNLGATPNPDYIGEWTTPGSQKPNYGWMLPATATANIAANEIWIGGGNITGGGGSYLIKASMLTAPPYTVSATQFSYDFRANSNNTTSGISAIEQSLIAPNKLFVATEDGTFFYSNNSGTSWTKTTAFSGPEPWYLYGSCILASKINNNLLWYSGSGYSNPPVYKSTDGGVTFTAMSNGLPSTLVNEMVASPDEKFIFAATEAGPYVYVVAENMWYTLSDNTVPVQFFTGVEYIRSSNAVRFATMGRGVWDFVITGALPVTLTQWQAQLTDNKVFCSWKTENEINLSHFLVERSIDGITYSTIGTVQAIGRNNSYTFIDNTPAKGINYYRLVSIDKDGKNKRSNIISVKTNADGVPLTIYPNPVKDILTVAVTVNTLQTVNITVIDASGKTVKAERMDVSGYRAFTISMATLPKGLYMLRIKGKSVDEAQKFIKE